MNPINEIAVTYVTAGNSQTLWFMMVATPSWKKPYLRTGYCGSRKPMPFNLT
jgi:hypothetical protein